MKKLISRSQLLLATLLLGAALLLPVALRSSAGAAGLPTASWTDPIEEGVGPLRQLPAAAVASWTDPIEESIGTWGSEPQGMASTVASWTDPIEEGIGTVVFEV